MSDLALLRRAGGALVSMALVGGVYLLVGQYLGTSVAALAALFVLGFALYTAGQPTGTAPGADDLGDQYE